MERFTSIALRNWRNFEEVDVELQRRSFLIGANGSGKSNFLDVFRFLRDIGPAGGGLQQAVESRGGVSLLRCLEAGHKRNIELRVSLGDDDERDRWVYELHFSQDLRLRPIVSMERIFKNNKMLLSRPDDEDDNDPERLSQTYLEQVNVNKDFRAIAEFFETIHYLHVVPQLIREPDRWVCKRNDPYGGDLLEQIARTKTDTRNSLLRKITEALATAVPQLLELGFVSDRSGTPHLRGRYLSKKPNGSWLNQKQFSDGTLRLIGLLWAVLQGRGPLLLEEPELSIHPGVVRYIPQMFAKVQSRTSRQILVSTHSAEMLLDEGIGLDEVLLLQPSAKGTVIKTASSDQEITDLVKGGATLAESVMPRTVPQYAYQLSRFGDDGR